MKPAPSSRKTIGSVRSQPAVRRRQVDDRFNEQMTLVLREAAELRAGRDRVRSGEDQRVTLDETSALLGLIRNRVSRRPAPAKRSVTSGPRTAMVAR